MAKRLGRYHPEQLILKITLAGSDPKIWRRVEVHSGLTLDDLHYVIQSVLNWSDSHLYQFLIPPGGKQTREAMRNAMRYTMPPPDPMFDDDDAAAGRAAEMLVGRAFTEDCRQIIYEYDFGDSWEHLIKLEKRTPGGDQEHTPVCLAGENAAPYDDMGGIHGYSQWLEALADKTDDMHEQAVDWLGEDFDPAHFDLDAANKRLKGVFEPAPAKRKPKKK